jgi:type I restriction enzyme S subunit
MTSNALLDLVEFDSLPRSWEVKKLEDVVDINQETSNLRDYSWIHYTDISSVGTRTVEMPSKLEVKDAPSRARRVLRKGDTVISSVRPNRKSFFYFNEEWTNAIASTGFAVLTPKDFDDAEYLHAVLTSENAVKIYEAICEGGAYPAFNPSRLNEIRIPWPPYTVRRELGHTVMNLQSKIAANNALSKTLEDIAQTIFKSWFIDFDPVKAKMAGDKPAGMDSPTAALFPDSMEELAFGLIPKGWNWKSIGEIAQVIDCLHSKKPELLSEGYPYLQLDTISDSGILRFENAGLISKEDYDKWTSRIEVQGGDCLITNVGRVGAVSQVPEHFKAAIGRNITAMRPNNALLHKSFLVIVLLSDFMKREIKRNTDSGTILEALNVKNIPNLIIPGPSDAVLLEFAKLCDPLQLQIQELHSMNVNLKMIRDSLLPRLMSGELQILEEMLA